MKQKTFIQQQNIQTFSKNCPTTPKVSSQRIFHFESRETTRKSRQISERTFKKDETAKEKTDK